MSYFAIVLIFLAIGFGLLIKTSSDKAKNFDDVISSELKKHKLHLVRSTYPGLFKVGPFKKFEISIGKPQINNGTVQYEHTYYRIIELENKRKMKKTVWAKIETSWFKNTKIQFNPPLTEVK